MGLCISSKQHPCHEFGGITCSQETPKALVRESTLTCQTASPIAAHEGHQHNAFDTAPASSIQQRPGCWVLCQPTPAITEHYRFGKVLGQGESGTVHLIEDLRTGERCACKCVAKSKLPAETGINNVRQEIQVLHHVSGHPHVAQLLAVYEDEQHVYLVLEHCAGGELFEHVARSRYCTELHAARMFRPMVALVQHLHSLGVIHRDIKPENFLLSDESPSAVIKAADFGMSVFFHEGEVLREVCGTPFYIAPEVLQGAYSKEVDIWGLGCMLHIMLSGLPPFWGSTREEVLAAVAGTSLQLTSKTWSKVSADAKDLLGRMLAKDPGRRPSAAEILCHPWLLPGGAPCTRCLHNEVVARLQRFGRMNKFKKEVLKLIAADLPPLEIAGVERLFQAYDRTKDGFICADELRDVLAHSGYPISQEELATLLKNVNSRTAPEIDFSAFLAATVHKSKVQREEQLHSAFTHFASGAGAITRCSLEAALAKYGDAGVVDEVLQEVDDDGDGQINYEEFRRMMRGSVLVLDPELAPAGQLQHMPVA